MPNSGHQTSIRDIQDGQGPDGPPDGPPDRVMTALLGILNERYSRYHENIMKNVQSPDSTTPGPGVVNFRRKNTDTADMTTATGGLPFPFIGKLAEIRA